MQNKLILVYIILESRISLKAACELFKISEEDLVSIMKNDMNHNLRRALKYLFYCESLTPNVINPVKAKIKASLLYKKYLNILKIENKNERKEKLNLFVSDISGNKIEYLKDKSRRDFTEEDKEFVFKYKIKFALTFRELEEYYHLYTQILLKWKKDLHDETLKKRLACLDEYNMCYFGVNSVKR